MRKTKKVSLFCILFISILTIASAQETVYSGIEIIGDEKFIIQVKKALEVIETRAPEELSFIKQRIGRIKQSERSGMVSDDLPPTFELADRSAFVSVTWCASLIAHDAYHSRLYDDYQKSLGGPGRDNNWTLQKEEKECLNYQLKVMRKINAPAKEIRCIESSDGTYYDLDKDGDYDWDDYNKRNW